MKVTTTWDSKYIQVARRFSDCAVGCVKSAGNRTPAFSVALGEMLFSALRQSQRHTKAQRLTCWRRCWQGLPETLLLLAGRAAAGNQCSSVVDPHCSELGTHQQTKLYPVKQCWDRAEEGPPSQGNPKNTRSWSGINFFRASGLLSLSLLLSHLFLWPAAPSCPLRPPSAALAQAFGHVVKCKGRADLAENNSGSQRRNRGLASSARWPGLSAGGTGRNAAGTPKLDRATQNNAPQAMVAFPSCGYFFLPPARTQGCPTAGCLERKSPHGL